MLVHTMRAAQQSTECLVLEQSVSRAVPEEIMRLEGAELGPVIPGIRQGAIPQGLAYSASYDLIFISFYFENARHPSSVAVIDRTSGKIVKTLALKESASDFHYGHVGGLAVDENFLWVASREKVYQYELQGIRRHESAVQVIMPSHAFIPEARASFSTYADGTLFIGEFVYQGSAYHSERSHHAANRTGETHYAWICGYHTAALNFDMPVPRSILSVRQKVQGIQLTDRYVLLSVSYGRRHESRIAIYHNPLNETPHAKIPLNEGQIIPLWYLDEQNTISEIVLPPLAEGITMIDGQLVILFESGAEKFQQGGKQPCDHLLFLDVTSYLAQTDG